MPKKKKSKRGRPPEGRVRFVARVKPETKRTIEGMISNNRDSNTGGKVLDKIISNLSVN